jgi:hypothetical protein
MRRHRAISMQPLDGLGTGGLDIDATELGRLTDADRPRAIGPRDFQAGKALARCNAATQKSD